MASINSKKAWTHLSWSRMENVWLRILFYNTFQQLTIKIVLPMTQMTSIGQLQTHDSSMRTNQSSVDGKVGGGTTQGLHIYSPVRILDSKHFQRSLLTEKFHLINVFIAGVVSGSGVPFRVLVGQARAKGIRDRFWSEVFRGNQFETLLLTRFLLKIEKRRSKEIE